MFVVRHIIYYLFFLYTLFFQWTIFLYSMDQQSRENKIYEQEGKFISAMYRYYRKYPESENDCKNCLPDPIDFRDKAWFDKTSNRKQLLKKLQKTESAISDVRED